ncbi:MAG: Tad domain-containing protein, partial [Planctomycetes bacterium]|nr:Tad domain-containing protein [Planctomycetota bacterium]
MHTLAATIRHRIRRLPQDESGQSALFAVLTLMLIIIVLAYTFNVGMTVNQRVRLQHAADSAAFSGAVVEANALSSIAWLNNCETYLHSKLQQHMIDVVMYSSASAVAEWGRYNYSKYSSKSDRKAYETQIIPHFLPVPFVTENENLEVFGAMQNLSGASNGYPPAGTSNLANPEEPAEEFAGVLDHRTFKNDVDTDISDILDQLEENAEGLPDAIQNMDNPLDGLLDVLTDVLDPATIATNLAQGIVSGIAEATVDAAKKAATGGSFNFNFTKVITDAVKSAVGETFQSLIEGLVSGLTDFATATVQDTIETILDQLLQMEEKQFKTFAEVFENDLYGRLNDKYDLSVNSPAGLVAATKDHILDDAKKWIADADERERLGETWIRQLSLTASAIAKAMPELIRNEILYSTSVNCHPDTLVAIFPAAKNPSGSGYTGNIHFDGAPALATTDAECNNSFFRYDAYTQDPATNRFLSESRRQAYNQGFKYVRKETKGSQKDTITIKPEIAYWWDEYEGKYKEEGDKSVFIALERCWNAKDRLVPGSCPDDDVCPIGYCPGRTPGSPMAKPIDRDNAADGHWHLEHGHAHGPDCKRTYGGFCIGYMPPGVFQCLIPPIAQEIAGQNHHFKYLNHETNFHWDPIADELKHVYCEVAWSNASKGMDLFGGSKKQQEQSEDEEKSRYPDIIPGIGMMKICWCLLKTRFQIVMIGPFPWLQIFCECGQHGTPGSNPPTSIKWSGKTNNTEKHGLPVGCFPAFFYDYIPFPWGWPLSNWPSGQNFPGHFYTKMDWEGRFSGDKYYYSRTHYMSFEGGTTDSVTGYGAVDALLGMLPGALGKVVFMTAEIYGRVTNWMSRKGHHGFMTCPLCMKKCPACGETHLAMDLDGDKQSDVGMYYSDLLDGHDKDTGSYKDYDLDLNIDEGATGDWKDNFCCDRFNRKWFSPERGLTSDPRTDLSPTVVATENLFRYGITVGLYQPHNTYFFKSFFGTRTGYVAVATARVGFVEQGSALNGLIGSIIQQTGGSGSVEPQIITGASEIMTDGSRWKLDDVKSQFLDLASNKGPRGNLYYPAWGAKLVSTRQGILPGGTSGTRYNTPGTSDIA